MIDLDNFKYINDSYGHKYGDELLKSVAERLLEVVRETDTVARLGGDEFVVIQTHITEPNHACRLAERIVSKLSTPYKIEGKQIHSGCSIGISYYPDQAKDLGELMQESDIALYSAKQSGRNCYHLFSKSVGEEIARYKYLDDKLRKSINKKEFHLVYQPQYDISTGDMVSVEGLVRWVTSDGEKIFPDEFIPIAEKTGLIVKLGKQLIRNACQDISNWMDEGLEPVPVAINLSALQLQDSTLPGSINRIMKSYDLTVDHLELEITETAMLNYEDAGCFENIMELDKLGFKFALDDFGVGYASLNYLHKIPCEKIKIDRSFVMDSDSSVDAKEIIRAITLLSKALNKKVVAEGVECIEHVEFLRTVGCDLVQGYLFNKPLDEDVLRGLLKRIGPPKVKDDTPENENEKEDELDDEDVVYIAKSSAV